MELALVRIWKEPRSISGFQPIKATAGGSVCMGRVCLMEQEFLAISQERRHISSFLLVEAAHTDT
jgi:hypothetical protein